MLGDFFCIYRLARCGAACVGPVEQSDGDGWQYPITVQELLLAGSAVSDVPDGLLYGGAGVDRLKPATTAWLGSGG